MSKQDRQGARTPAQLEQEFQFGKSFAEAMGLAQEAMDEAEEAKKATEDLDKSLDPTEIFNRLTNNGEVEGIYRDEAGNVYINASYIISGILRSADGSTFYLDLDKGILKGKFAEFSISGKTVEDIAQEKANAAESNAINTASAYAATKANAAESNAIAAAANDATNKANSALSSAKDYADGVTVAALNAQTQTDIFNKLTNNGALKGLYMENGELYINASYLMSGIINAARIKTGVITSSNGSVKVDLDNNTIIIGGLDATPETVTQLALNFEGLFGYGKNYSTGSYKQTLEVVPGCQYSASVKLASVIAALDGVPLNVETDGGTLRLGSTEAETKIYGSTITVLGAMRTGQINPGKTELFSGNVAMGNSCTVPKTEFYDLFAVKLGDSSTTYDTVVLAYKTGKVVRGVGGWAGTATESKQLYFFSATISGDTWTVEDAGVHNVYIGGGVEEGTRLNLKSITGII